MTVSRFRKARKRPMTAREFLTKMRGKSGGDAFDRTCASPGVNSIPANSVDEQPVVHALAGIGLRVESIADLFNKKQSYARAVPILLEWLPKVTSMDVKEDIVRALSVRWARPAAALPLVEEFRRADDYRGAALKWAIANALSVVADDRVFEAVADLARDRRHGKAREMLAFALGNMVNERAVDVLIELLSDEETAGHAIMALGRLKAARAKEKIAEFRNHDKAWIRRETHKALRNIERGGSET